MALLDSGGATVTIAAMGTQPAIAAQRVEGGADYLKANPPNGYEEVTLGMNTEYDAGRLSVLETVAKDHGRSTRLAWLDGRANWAGLNALGMVESRRESGAKVSIERRYYWCSRPKLAHFSPHCRAPWRTANSPHGVLEVQFGEDRNRARTDYRTANLAWRRRTAWNLIRHHGKPRDSWRTRRFRARLNDDYRLALLTGTFLMAT